MCRPAERRTAKLSAIIRYSLAAFFAASGIWQSLYSIALFRLFAGMDIGGIVARAWSIEVTSISFFVVPSSWLGIEAAIVYGTRAEAYVAMLAATSQILVATGLLLRSRISALFALFFCGFNLFCCSAQLAVLCNSMLRDHSSQSLSPIVWLALSFLLYAVISFFLAKDLKSGES